MALKLTLPTKQPSPEEVKERLRPKLIGQAGPTFGEWMEETAAENVAKRQEVEKQPKQPKPKRTPKPKVPKQSEIIDINAINIKAESESLPLFVRDLLDLSDDEILARLADGNAKMRAVIAAQASQTRKRNAKTQGPLSDLQAKLEQMQAELSAISDPKEKMRRFKEMQEVMKGMMTGVEGGEGEG